MIQTAVYSDAAVWLQEFGNIILNIFMFQTLCTVMQLLRVHILVWMLLQGISDLIRLSVQRTSV